MTVANEISSDAEVVTALKLDIVFCSEGAQRAALRASVGGKDVFNSGVALVHVDNLRDGVILFLKAPYAVIRIRTIV